MVIVTELLKNEVPLKGWNGKLLVEVVCLYVECMSSRSESHR